MMPVLVVILLFSFTYCNYIDPETTSFEADQYTSTPDEWQQSSTEEPPQTTATVTFAGIFAVSSSSSVVMITSPIPSNTSVVGPTAASSMDVKTSNGYWYCSHTTVILFCLALQLYMGMI